MCGHGDSKAFTNSMVWVTNTSTCNRSRMSVSMAIVKPLLTPWCGSSIHPCVTEVEWVCGHGDSKAFTNSMVWVTNTSMCNRSRMSVSMAIIKPLLTPWCGSSIHPCVAEVEWVCEHGDSRAFTDSIVWGPNTSMGNRSRMSVVWAWR